MRKKEIASEVPMGMNTLPSFVSPKRANSLSSKFLKKTLGILFFIPLLVPATSYASSLGGIISTLPPAILTQLQNNAPSFVANPDTIGFAGLSQANINLILNNLNPATLASLPSDMFSSFATAQIQLTLSTILPSSLSNITTALSGLPQATLTSVLNGLGSSVLANISSGVFSSMPSSSISLILNGLSGVSLQGLTGSLANLPANLLKGVVQQLNTSMLGFLPTNIFSNLSAGQLTNLLNSLPGSALQALTGSLASLPAGMIQNILQGLNSSLLSFLPSDLFSMLSGGSLNGILQNLISGGFSSVVSALSGSLFSGLSSGVLGSLASGVISALGAPVQTIISGILGGGIGGIVGGFGLFVPVYDVALNPAFNSYVSKLFTRWDNTFGAKTPNGTTDSLRDLIAGSNPDVSTLGGDCATSPTPWSAWADGYGPSSNATTGPWYWAAAAAQQTTPKGDLPYAVPDPLGSVEINSSNSLRCLLKELVSWQKLGLSLQINALLKTYISDAQTVQLNGKLQNAIAQVNLEWAKQGNVVTNAGNTYTTPVYNTNISANRYDAANRQLEEAADEAGNDPAGGSPQGAWGLCEPWRYDAVATILKSNRTSTADPYDYTQAYTSCNLTTGAKPTFASQNDYASFEDNFNSPSNLNGGLMTFISVMNNPANNPLDSIALADAATRGRIERQVEVTNQKAANSGFVPTTTIDPTNPQNPHGVDEQFGIDTSPAGQNQQTVTDMAAEGDRQVASAKTLDAQGGAPTQQLSSIINTQGGLLSYDTTPGSSPLYNSSTTVNNLVQEFYNTIQYGYYGIDDGCPTGTPGGFDAADCGGTKALNTPNVAGWAEATMLSIYDQMKFNFNKPEVTVTDGQAPVPLGF